MTTEGKTLSPVRSCMLPTILEFFQSLLEDGRAPSTPRVHVAAISLWHAPIGDYTIGGQGVVTSFLRGASRLWPPVTPRIPEWDLSLVLDALSRPPFEPLAQAELKWMSMKMAFLLAVISGELHALSISEPCLRWPPGD